MLATVAGIMVLVILMDVGLLSIFIRITQKEMMKTTKIPDSTWKN